MNKNKPAFNPLGAEMRAYKHDQSRPTAPVVAEGLTDAQIEAQFKARGGNWDGNRWTIEDADLHPFVRSLAAHPVVGSPAEASGNWPEDFQRENGNYQNKCSSCDGLFIGHKRRTTCKRCAAPVPASEAASDWTVGNLLTMSDSDYPGMGSVFGQIWQGDDLIARVYGDNADEVRERTARIAAPAAPTDKKD